MNRRTFVVISISILMPLILLFGYGSIFDISYSASKPFLDQKKVVPPRQEWNREIISQHGGTFNFRISSQGQIGVTIVTEEGYKAITVRDMSKFKKEYILLTVDSKRPVYEGKIRVPAGSSWFIIENQTDNEVEMHLQCVEQD